MAPEGLGQCQKDLEDLETRLPVSIIKRKTFKAKLLWLLREKDIPEALKSIHRVRGIIAMTLSADSTATMVEI